jgi:hypothetical protein
MTKPIKMWIAVDHWNNPTEWTISSLRRDAMQKATECMMGANEYRKLETLRARWAYCYRHGRRIVRCTVSVDATK